MKTHLLSLALIGLAAAPVVAQYPPKDAMAADFARQKVILLQYVDVMPDSGYGFAPTQGVRTYAQQLEHIAQATAGITAQVTGASAKPPKGDAAMYPKSKAAMRDFMTQSFDFAIASVTAMAETGITEEIEIFGLKRARWKWVIGVQEHTAWTLGATVPYLRLNGVTPPSYLPF
jgi:hypothetical protein